MVRGLRGTRLLKKKLEAVRNTGEETLGTIRVERGSSLDFLTNGWLLYQTLSAVVGAQRILSIGGVAFGLRDQRCRMSWRLFMPDTTLVRQHCFCVPDVSILEGDVQHGGINDRSWCSHTLLR
jgi:cellobiose phosphorylase